MTIKDFEFVYTQTTDDLSDCTFSDVEFPHRTNISHSVSFSEDVRWVAVIKQFAMFLDSTGYVGVADAIDDFIAKKDAALFKYLEEDDDEDTSNPGLSD